MAQQVQTSMMTGGLDLITPPIAMPPGKAISAINYEPDVAGYTSMGGYERFDGRPRPSEVADLASVEGRRSAILPPPGEGPVRGVYVFAGNIYCFRDQEDGFAGMFRATNAGWTRMSFGQRLDFGAGVSQFVAGDFVLGSDSSAIARIDRVVTRSGNYAVAPGNTATGYLIISSIDGTFEEEQITSTSGGNAMIYGPSSPIIINSGGHYDFITHNFYGAAFRPSMYFVNGVDTGFGWDGEVLMPILTGISGGTSTSVTPVLSPPSVAPHTTDSPIYTPANPDPPPVIAEMPVIASASFDAPSFIAQFKNHLFLGYTSGTILFSSLGEPLEFRTDTGSGEISFGQQITGLLEAAKTSLVVTAQNRVEYVTGTDAGSFALNPLTDASGAQAYTMQMMDEPMFLDDGGVRKMSATSAFGDWRMGAVTASVEPLINLKRNQGIVPVASQKVKSRDQYRLYWSDRSGVTVYIGRKYPETLPFKLGMQVFCACSGEVDIGYGERLFVGATDGFVYEMNCGTSYDGNPIPSYIRLPFTSAGSPSQHTRWMKATFELSTPDPITIGVSFDIDYAKGLGGEQTLVAVDAGTALISTDALNDSWDASIGSWDNSNVSMNWMPVQARLEYHLSGLGPNIAATLVHNSAVARQHTISSQTYNFSRRKIMR